MAIFTTHPIQYYVPWFQMLARQSEIELTVYYGFFPNAKQQGEGFGLSFKWDIPLLDGYQWHLLKKQSDCSKSGSSFYNTKQLNRIFLRNKADIAIITGWHALMLLQALFFCRLHQTPVMVRGDSNALRGRPYYLRLLHHFLLTNFDAFLSVGKANKDFYLQNGVKPWKIFETPHCVDNQRFLFQLKQVSGSLKQLDKQMLSSEDSVRFLYVGKLIEKKRIMDLLKAFKLAQDRKSTIHLVVVGDGKLMEKARYYAAQHNLRITFTGFLNQTEIIHAYASSDCLVLPSNYGETWGLVVNEAMICGLPAIVSDRVGCGPDLIKNYNTGVFFPFGNVDVLAKKIVFMASKKRCQKMGACAQQLIIEKYSIERAVQGTMEAMKMVLSIHN